MSSARMLEPRAFAASLAINDSTLWVTGGSGNNSTEWINTRVSSESFTININDLSLNILCNNLSLFQ